MSYKQAISCPIKFVEQEMDEANGYCLIASLIGARST